MHDEEDRNLEMPFHYTQFGAVLMVDIVGFSQVILHLQHIWYMPFDPSVR